MELKRKIWGYKKWHAKVTFKKVVYNLGYFDEEIDVHRACQEKRKENNKNKK